MNKCPACHTDIEDQRGVDMTLFDITRPPPHMIYTTICRRCVLRLDNYPRATQKKILETIRRTFRQSVVSVRGRANG